MSFGGKFWDISASSFNIAPIALGSPDCIGGIGASSGCGCFFSLALIFLDVFFYEISTILDCRRCFPAERVHPV
jgi:hypothetical protein